MPDNFDAARVASAFVACSCRRGRPCCCQQKALINAINDCITIALLAARKAPEGHVIDDRGVVRKVLGTLPITADGRVLGSGGVVYINDVGDITGLVSDQIGATEEVGGDVAFWSADECYSTREAAEPAKEQA